jgi:hypothetical protein
LPVATTEYLWWSDQTIRFSRADHPRKVPKPGHAPMVLKAQIGGYNIGRVFMDTSSDINLIYARTLKAMSILIRLKRVYNFLCSMLVYTPFALCFVTLRGVFMNFPELTY